MQPGSPQHAGQQRTGAADDQLPALGGQPRGRLLQRHDAGALEVADARDVDGDGTAGRGRGREHRGQQRQRARGDGPDERDDRVVGEDLDAAGQGAAVPAHRGSGAASGRRGPYQSRTITVASSRTAPALTSSTARVRTCATSRGCVGV